MTVVAAHSDTPEGRAAVDRGVEEALLRRTGLVVVDLAATGPAADSARDRLAGADLPFEVRELHGLEPADAVVQVAQQTDADLVVIGLRRRSPVGKLFLGSHAQRILLTADCPVIAVKADATTSG